MNTLVDAVPYLKVLHLVAMAMWTGGTIAALVLTTQRDRLPTMEAQSAALRLMRHVVNPALFATLIFGAAIASALGRDFVSQAGWLKIKLPMVLVLCALHGFVVVRLKQMRRGEATRPMKGAFFLAAAVGLPVLVIAVAILKPL